MKVSIVYWSGTGNTEAMANAVAEGAKSAGAEVELLPVSAASADVVDSDVLLYGLPRNGRGRAGRGRIRAVFLVGRRSRFREKRWDCSALTIGRDGEWMRTWRQRVEAAGGVMIADGVTCIRRSGFDDALAACRALGEKAAK